MEPAEALLAAMAEHKITLHPVFVPQSLSRSKADSRPTLNWSVTVKVNDKDILTADYTAGIYHANIPGREKHEKLQWFANLEKMVAEYGRTPSDSAVLAYGNRITPAHLSKPVELDQAAFMGCILSDASALDYADFESWASEFDYNSDSRKAEATYNECLKTGLKLNAALGPDTLHKLQSIAQEL